MVTGVLNQGQCDSGWAFAAVGALESANAIATGTLKPLSKQQLIDCDYNNKGCKGGSPEIAFKHYEKGVYAMTESEYPYEAKDGKCRYDKKRATSGVTVSSYSKIEKGDRSKLEDALSQQPVVVGLDADCLTFRLYKKGVLDVHQCYHGVTHHALAVGFGVDPTGKDFWKVKNSYGVGWGEDGYIRLARNAGNDSEGGPVGILTQAVYPTV